MADLSEIASGLKPTVPVYWRDSYKQRLGSNIIRIEPDEKRHYYIVLDETIFHPKGGGQPADKGILEGAEFKFQVKKAMLAGSSVIIHWGKLVEGELKTGLSTSAVDWDWRYLMMRRHSAAHLLDHCLGKAVGRQVEALDSWLGDPTCYVAYKGECPPPNQLSEAEQIENQIIKQNRLVRAEELALDEAKRRYPGLSIPPLDRVRLVSVEGCQPIPCGGTHLKGMAEAGSVRVDRAEEHGDGFRLYFDLMEGERQP